MTDDLQTTSENEPKFANEDEAGSAVTGEPAVSPELQGVFLDQSMPRSPQRPSFAEWWREYQEKMRNAQVSSLSCHPLRTFAT